jgi:CobW/HypB/UreG, nucleotide-binding domain
VTFAGGAKRPWIVLVGGFPGAGKTSLILKAAQLLEERGTRCAVILNDQGEELVDSELAGLNGIASSEVTGGCFCCRFSDLLVAMDDLRGYAPEVIFAEPVGSCTDIAATVVGPLLEEFDRCRVAPLTVLVDPARAALLSDAEADVNLKFLMQKQLQEADLVCISKADTYPEDKGVPGVVSRRISAKTGQGVQLWLDEILCGVMKPGVRTLEIDYEEYARAEAALAWLNLSFTFAPTRALSPALVVGPLLDGVDEALSDAGVTIVHLKMIDRSSTGWLKAAICANGAEPSVEGALDASPAARHELLLNLRAVGAPEIVREAVEAQLARLEGELTELRLDCFSPAAPKPERRIAGSHPD